MDDNKPKSIKQMNDPDTEPDKTRTYTVDGMRVKVNFFSADNGKTVEETVEDFITEQAEKRLKQDRGGMTFGGMRYV